MVKIYAPASIGNINVGFDVLGATILPIDGSLLGDYVTVEQSNVFSLHNEGFFVTHLPNKLEDNIVYQCWQQFCAKIGCVYPVTIHLEKHVPVASGLGSSACSIVATLMAMNVYCDYPLSNYRLLKLMGKMEGLYSGEKHFDNVAPCFLGGIQLIINENNIISQSIPGFNNWLWVIAYPGIKVSTMKARKVLPNSYDRNICITHSRYLAGFVHACHTRQEHLAGSLMKDVIAEPYRVKFLPGFIHAHKYLINIGAIACGIAGSGPTLFSIFNNEKIALSAVDWLSKFYVKNNQGFVGICRLNNNGAYIVME